MGIALFDDAQRTFLVPHEGVSGGPTYHHPSPLFDEALSGALLFFSHQRDSASI